MSEVKTIKKVTANGTTVNQYDNTDLYQFIYQFTDDSIIHARHKSQSGFEAGSQVDVEVKGQYSKGNFMGENYGQVKKVSSYSPGGQSGPGKSDDYVKGIEVGHAVNNAVNMICAGVEFKDIDPNYPNDVKIKYYARKIMEIASELKAER